ncbi:MAG TPA: hypothetical protein VG166_09190 [Caulobacteraceae bacterium]|jgi:hypothetical protein|nr:hypothetical protein [Caulobacteraceae bacterium]
MEPEVHNFKITVRMQRRRDGGLRVWSDDVPELVLSHRDHHRVLRDIEPALNHILSARLGCEVRVERLGSLPHAVRAPVRPPVLTFERLFGLRRKLEFSASPCTA